MHSRLSRYAGALRKSSEAMSRHAASADDTLDFRPCVFLLIIISIFSSYVLHILGPTLTALTFISKLYFFPYTEREFGFGKTMHIDTIVHELPACVKHSAPLRAAVTFRVGFTCQKRKTIVRERCWVTSRSAMFKIFVGTPTTRFGACQYKKQPGRIYTIFLAFIFKYGLGH